MRATVKTTRDTLTMCVRIFTWNLKLTQYAKRWLMSATAPHVGESKTAIVDPRVCPASPVVVDHASMTFCVYRFKHICPHVASPTSLKLKVARTHSRAHRLSLTCRSEMYCNPARSLACLRIYDLREQCGLLHDSSDLQQRRCHLIKRHGPI